MLCEVIQLLLGKMETSAKMTKLNTAMQWNGMECFSWKRATMITNPTA